jgi:hypothetical protein
VQRGETRNKNRLLTSRPGIWCGSISSTPS